MGFSKIFLQDLKHLKENYEADKESFKKIMRKAEVIIGPPESMKFVESVLSEEKKSDQKPNEASSKVRKV